MSTLRALWRDQEARHPEPPTPALIDALYEAGEDALAWRLHWCREWGVVPERGVVLDDMPYYTWNHVGVQRVAGEKFFHDLLGLSLRLWRHRLGDAYALLLHVPQEKFPCK